MLDGGKLVLGRKRNIKNNIPKGMFSSVVTEVLEEELGISKEAYDESNRMFMYIEKIISDKTKYKFYFIDNILVYGVQNYGDIDLFDGKYTINYHFNFIFIKNAEEFDKYSKSIQLEYLGFSQEDNLLFIKMPIMCPDIDNVKMDNETSFDLYNTLQHEFKHIYQKYMLSQKDEKRNILDYKKSKVYQKATEWIYAHNYDGSDLCKMFWAIYYLTPVEITANAQALYGEIKKRAKDKGDAIDVLSNSEFMEEMQIYSNLLEKLNNNKIKLSDLMLVQRKLGRNTEWIIKYINKGINKMKQSVRKIEKLIDKEYV
jgi:hypothetical protein